MMHTRKSAMCDLGERFTGPHLRVVASTSTVPMALGSQPFEAVTLPPPRLGDYRVLALLAKGGMGGVYLGEHVVTGERVAIKVLDARWAAHDSIVARLMGEYEVSQRVSHEGLVRIHAASQSEDVPYLLMEVLDGENLASLLGRSQIELGAVAAIGAQVADAVAAMHDARVVHCDLKPENVMVLYRDGLAGWPRAKVLDFGVARFDESLAIQEIAGTPCYMAPEQWRGHAEARSDVYALGCLLYELATGRAPFEGPIAQVMADHHDRLPPAISTHRVVPGSFDRLVSRMLAKEPGMRPRMNEIARSLADVAYAMPPGARGGAWCAAAGSR